MSQTETTGAFADVLDDGTRSKADYGVSAKRKARLASYKGPLSALAQRGVEIPHRDFDVENIREYPTTAVFEDGCRVHLHQDVKEDMDDDVFGDFGSVDEDDEDIVWTVVSLADETVTLTVVGDWSKRRNVPYEEFADDYEPLHLSDGQPQWGY